MANKPVIGLLGGGQLGRMLCEAAGPLGIAQIAVLDEENSPAKQANHNDLHVTGSFKDPAKIKELAAKSDLLTVEIEHVDTDILEEIATKGVEVDGKMKKVPVHPSWKTIRLIQDKYQQKAYFGQKGIPIVEQMAIESGLEQKASLQEAGQKLGFPLMLKGAKGSYDGRGNLKICSAEDFDSVAKQMGEQPLYAEKWVPFEMELAVIVMRTEKDDGSFDRVIPYPVAETIHEDSICTKTYYPARKITDDVQARAQKVACDVIASLWGRGVFAVEMFLLKDGQILVNEVAPRPHNSGHYTIEAVPQMSQYKAQLCAILNRLPKTVDLTPRVPSAIMLNILGGAKPDSHDRLVSLAEETGDEFTTPYLHQYGKLSKPGRKIGHITVTGQSSIEKLEERSKPLIHAVDEIRRERVGESAPAGTSSSKASGAAPLVMVTMGSDSDLNIMIKATDILDEFDVPYEWHITSAHRTAGYMMEKAEEWSQGGVMAIIAGAGGAAHLPGMLASETHVPVVGVPIKGSTLEADSLHSIVQMPRGCPVGTMGINNATNAGLYAVRILGGKYTEYATKMRRYQEKMKAEVLAKEAKASTTSPRDYLNNINK